MFYKCICYTYISIFNDYSMWYSYRCYMCKYYMYIRSLQFVLSFQLVEFSKRFGHSSGWRLAISSTSSVPYPSCQQARRGHRPLTVRSHKVRVTNSSIPFPLQTQTEKPQGIRTQCLYTVVRHKQPDMETLRIRCNVIMNDTKFSCDLARSWIESPLTKPTLWKLMYVGNRVAWHMS